LLHYVDGAVYPKRTPVSDNKIYRRTGDLMPAVTKFARVAPAGVHYYRRDHLGPAYKGNLFSAHFNPHRAFRRVLHRDEGAFSTGGSDLTSSDTDCYPSDVLEDAGGSLLVVDRGGWFLGGCPVSRISNSRRAEMARRDHAAVRRQAAEALGRIGDAGAVPALIDASADPDGRCVEHAIIYALIRLRHPAPLTVAPRYAVSRVRKASLIALDQMDGDPLRREHFVAQLGATDEPRGNAAAWVGRYHPEWFGDIRPFLRAHRVTAANGGAHGRSPVGSAATLD
jgi:hypothetical protein